MKLRRAMAVAAATAAIAPLALLSAPAAFAADGSPSPIVSASQSPSGSASASPSDSAPASSAPASQSPSGSAPAPSGSASASASASGSSTPSASASATPTDSASPTAVPSDCPVDDDGVDPDSQLSLAVSGLPGKIVAGSGWHNFSLTAANHSDQDLGQVQWLAAVDNFSESENENDWLSTYAQLEYFNPTSKAWESIADEVGNGVYFGETTLGAKQKVAIKLRVNISAQAPAGDGYALGLGGYVDKEKDCVHSSFAYYELTILKAGSTNENPGEAKPGKGGDKPSGGKEPQGGADEIPATGSLASTGSSSALPTIALVGGIAVVAGAGAVFVVRRRKSGDATA